MEDQELKHLLRENLEYSRQILEVSIKTKKYLFWVKILNIIKTVLIALPIIFALIYLPPIIRDLLKDYNDIFDQVEAIKKGNVKDVNPNVIQQILP